MELVRLASLIFVRLSEPSQLMLRVAGESETVQALMLTGKLTQTILLKSTIEVSE